MSTELVPSPAMSPFIEFLLRLEHGRLVDSGDDALVNMIRELHKAERSGGKPKGDITLKISFNLDQGMLETLCDLKLTKPRMKRSRTVLFASEDGEIVGEAPRQLGLFPKAEAADVASVETAPVSVSVAAPLAAPISTMAPAADPVPYSPQDAAVDAALGHAHAIPVSTLRLAQ